MAITLSQRDERRLSDATATLNSSHGFRWVKLALSDAAETVAEIAVKARATKQPKPFQTDDASSLHATLHDAGLAVLRWLDEPLLDWRTQDDLLHAVRVVRPDPSEALPVLIRLLDREPSLQEAIITTAASLVLGEHHELTRRVEDAGVEPDQLAALLRELADVQKHHALPSLQAALGSRDACLRLLAAAIIIDSGLGGLDAIPDPDCLFYDCLACDDQAAVRCACIALLRTLTRKAPGDPRAARYFRIAFRWASNRSLVLDILRCAFDFGLDEQESISDLFATAIRSFDEAGDLAALRFLGDSPKHVCEQIFQRALTRFPQPQPPGDTVQFAFGLSEIISRSPMTAPQRPLATMTRALCRGLCSRSAAIQDQSRILLRRGYPDYGELFELLSLCRSKSFWPAQDASSLRLHNADDRGVVELIKQAFCVVFGRPLSRLPADLSGLLELIRQKDPLPAAQFIRQLQNAAPELRALVTLQLGVSGPAARDSIPDIIQWMSGATPALHGLLASAFRQIDVDDDPRLLEFKHTILPAMFARHVDYVSLCSLLLSKPWLTERITQLVVAFKRKYAKLFRDSIEELAQMVMSALIQRMHRNRTLSFDASTHHSFGPWVSGIVRNVLRDEARQRRRLQKHEFLECDAAFSALERPLPDPQSVPPERDPCVDHVMHFVMTQLPIDQQRVLVLGFIQGLPRYKIAQLMGTSDRHVRYLYQKAQNALRRRFPDYVAEEK